MGLNVGKKLYVRVDSKVKDVEYTQQDYEDFVTYTKNVAKERYFIGGPFSCGEGSMILFEAENFEEAQKIVQSDPFIERGFSRCELYEWTVAVFSEGVGML